MNVYSCLIDLKDDAKALAFAKAVEDWMSYLQAEELIMGWRLLRRKLNLNADCYRDFLLEIEVDGLSQLDLAFRRTGSHDEQVEALHRAVHDLVGRAEFALYRPFPDPERSERMALL
ncbi:DUF6614 family protein [Sulfitobacter sp. LCG007]